MARAMSGSLDRAPGVALRREDADQRIVAGLLATVESEGRVSQRQLSAQLGVALGLVNMYVKRCVKKGLIKVRNVPSRRYMYYLTPQGFSEKARLTAEFLAYSFTSFREARSQCSTLMDDALARSWQSIVLMGASDITEIAILCALERGITVDAVIDEVVTKPKIVGVTVLPRLEELSQPCDGFIVTGIQNAQALYDGVVQAHGGERVLAPPMLSITTKRRRSAGR
jgi:DNA-binding MarR family transcriptional regulator